jgi:hypothetical protein
MNPTAPASEPEKTGKKMNVMYILKIFLIIIAFIGVIGLVYWLAVFAFRVNRGIINSLIAQDSTGYQNPVEFQKIVMQGVFDIEKDPTRMRQAEEFAKSTNTPIERVLVTMSEAEAKQYGLIA